MSLRRLASVAIVFGVALLSANCKDDPISLPGRKPAQLAIVDGQGQSGIVARELAEPLVIRVLDESGAPIAGQLIDFRVMAGGGTLQAASGVTNADGIAQNRWTLGVTTAVTHRVEVRVISAQTGEPVLFGEFLATPLPDLPVALEAISAREQQATVGTAVPEAPAVRVVDRYGNPVGGLPVLFRIDSGGGDLGAPSTKAVTIIGSAQSVVQSPAWILGTAAGKNQIVASVQGLDSLRFTATGVPDFPTKLDVLGTPPPGNAYMGVPIGEIVVVLLDQYRNRVSQAGVSISAGIAPVTGLPPIQATLGGTLTRTTDANGVARFTDFVFTGKASGIGLITFTIAGASTYATTTWPYGMIAGPATSIHKVAGDGNTFAPGSEVWPKPAVKLLDVYGNQIQSGTITFSTTDGELQGASAYIQYGVAEVWWILPMTAGTKTLTATGPNGLTTTFTAVVAGTAAASLEGKDSVRAALRGKSLVEQPEFAAP